MITYSELRVGDKLRIVGEGAEGFAQLGDIVTVSSVTPKSVIVENEHGVKAQFMHDCGAGRLDRVVGGP